MIKRYLVVPDIHIPYHDVSFLALIPKIVKLAKIDGIIQLGDALDFWQISSYDKNPLRKQTVAEDIKIFNGILDQWCSLVSEVRLLEGNHEDRLRRYVWSHARELTEVVKSVPEMLRLRDRKIKWHPIADWKSCQIGDCVLHHGHYFNAHVAVGNLTRYPRKLITGHTHRFQYASNGDRYSVTLGHGSNETETAHQPTPTGWQQAMGILTVVRGVAHFEPILVAKGRCVVYGQEVKA